MSASHWAGYFSGPARPAFDSANGARPPGGSRAAIWAVCVLLVLAVGIVFLQTAAFQFVNLDDDQYVVNSPATHLGFTRAGMAWAFTHSQIGNWHPLTTLSLMLDWSLFGSHPGGYHIHNLILHAATVVLLFLALRGMTGALWPSALAVAIFAIHPLRAESVAWISERKDVLSGFYFALGLLAYGYYVARPSAPRYALLFLCMAMGLMSKAMLVTLPVVLFLLDYWPLRRFRFHPAAGPRNPAPSWKEWFAADGRLIIEKVPLLLLSACFALITARLSLAASRAVAIVPLRVRLAVAPISCVTYLGKMVYPFGLAAHYPFPVDGPPAIPVVGACLILLTISLGVVVYRQRRPYLLAGWLWYLVTLSPVIGLVPGGNQLMADRYTYIPQIGLCVAFVWLAADLSATWPSRRSLCIGGSVALIVGLMAIAWRQTSFWFDSIALWRHALSCTSGNDIAHEHLADALVEKSHGAAARTDDREAMDDLQEARGHFEQALEIMPGNVEALINLGNLLTGQGDPRDAIPLYGRALKLNPGVAATYYDLGNALRATGDAGGAMSGYRKAIELDPGYVAAHNNLGNLLAEKGMNDEAVVNFRQAVAEDPKFTQGYSNLANALLAQGNLPEAAASFEQALKIDPDNLDAHANLGTALSRAGRLEEAIVEYQRALEIDSHSPVTWYNLGYCYEQTGRLRDAFTSYGRALELIPSTADSAFAGTIRSRMKICGQGLKSTQSP